MSKPRKAPVSPDVDNPLASSGTYRNGKTIADQKLAVLIGFASGGTVRSRRPRDVRVSAEAVELSWVAE